MTVWHWWNNLPFCPQAQALNASSFQMLQHNQPPVGKSNGQSVRICWWLAGGCFNLHGRMHPREKEDSRNSKVLQAVHVLYPAFITVITVLSSDSSLAPFSCSLCPLSSKAHTPTSRNTDTHPRSRSRVEGRVTQGSANDQYFKRFGALHSHFYLYLCLLRLWSIILHEEH